MLRTRVGIRISGLLVPGPPTCQLIRGVLGEEGHDVAAPRGQPRVQRRGDAQLDHGPGGAGLSHPKHPPALLSCPFSGTPWAGSEGGGLLPAGGVPASGLGVSLVQEVGALAVEVDGALVVGQGLAVTGVGGSQEAGQAIHCHWDGGETGVQAPGEPYSLVLVCPPRWDGGGGSPLYLPLILVTGERVSTRRIRRAKSSGSCSWRGTGDAAVMGPPRG